MRSWRAVYLLEIADGIKKMEPHVRAMLMDGVRIITINQPSPWVTDCLEKKGMNPFLSGCLSQADEGKRPEGNNDDKNESSQETGGRLLSSMRRIHGGGALC